MNVEVSDTRSVWRYFPWIIVGALGVVVSVNLIMATLAIRTFPGVAVEGAFRKSNAYSLVLQAAERQAALGWSVAVDGDGARPTLRLHGKDAAPLVGAQVSAAASRPMGTDAPVDLRFRPTVDGGYVAQDDLPLVGQWDLMLVITHGGETLRLTRRVFVR